jgi:hypothetical protein
MRAQFTAEGLVMAVLLMRRRLWWRSRNRSGSCESLLGYLAARITALKPSQSWWTLLRTVGATPDSSKRPQIFRVKSIPALPSFLCLQCKIWSPSTLGGKSLNTRKWEPEAAIIDHAQFVLHYEGPEGLRSIYSIEMTGFDYTDSLEERR